MDYLNVIRCEFRNNNIKVTFGEFGQEESGVDMGGVFKEFLEYGLFKRTGKNALYYPNPIAKHFSIRFRSR